MNIPKRAVTPVIATIILIASTLVIGMVLAVFTSGIFGANVVMISLTSGVLYSGTTSDSATSATSSLSAALNNPGPATYISGISLTGSGISSISTWCNSNVVACAQINFANSGTGNALGPGQVTTLVFYPATPTSITLRPGETFNYVISFANGQSISGSLVAQ